MPLSDNPKTREDAATAVDLLHKVFGSHPGYRAVHAKGTLLSGTFKPTEEAMQLTAAPHFNQPSTTITVRYSNATGIPHIPDTDPNGNPRGFAIRFHLGDRKHTDIITQSSPFFPVKNGTEFIQFFEAVIADTVPDFLSSHPAAVASVQAPNPTPKSMATARYFGVNALKFVNADGKETYFRYRLEPDAGLQTFTEVEVKDKSPNFLFEEIHERIKSSPVSFSLCAQLANASDITDDGTAQWPEDRKVVKLGTIIIDSSVANDDEQQRMLIMDPLPRVKGIEPSDDPLPDFRASVYLISGRERRAAKVQNS